MSGDVTRSKEKDRLADPTGTSAADTPDPATTFDLLAHERRRRIIRHLADRGGTVTETLDDVAHRLAADEVGAAGDVTDADRLAVRLSLVHTHLPLLEGAGAVKRDERTGRLAAGTHADHLLSVLETHVE